MYEKAQQIVGLVKNNPKKAGIAAVVVGIGVAAVGYALKRSQINEPKTPKQSTHQPH